MNESGNIVDEMDESRKDLADRKWPTVERGERGIGRRERGGRGGRGEAEERNGKEK
jgi:hypothetical protein